MYIISGITKLRSFGHSEAKRLAAKLPAAAAYSSQLVFLAGLFEVVTSAAVLYCDYTNTRADVARISLYALAAFTVMVTGIFYTCPFKHLPVLSNITALSALLLLAHAWDHIP